MPSPPLSKLSLTIDDTFLPPEVVSMIASESNSHWFYLKSSLKLILNDSDNLLSLKFAIERKGMDIFQTYLSTPWIGVTFEQCRKQLNLELSQSGGFECSYIQASLSGDLVLRISMLTNCTGFNDKFMIDQLVAGAREAKSLKNNDTTQYATVAYAVIEKFTTWILTTLNSVVPSKYGELRVTNPSILTPMTKNIVYRGVASVDFETVNTTTNFRIFSNVGWQRDFLTMMLWSIPEPVEFLEKTKQVATAAKAAQSRNTLPMLTQQLLHELETAANTPLPLSVTDAEIEREDL